MDDSSTNFLCLAAKEKIRLVIVVQNHVIEQRSLVAEGLGATDGATRDSRVGALEGVTPEHQQQTDLFGLSII